MTGGLDSSLTTRLILILARQAAQGQRMLRRICLDINFVSGQGQERAFQRTLGPWPRTLDSMASHSLFRSTDYVRTAYVTPVLTQLGPLLVVGRLPCLKSWLCFTGSPQGRYDRCAWSDKRSSDKCWRVHLVRVQLQARGTNLQQLYLDTPAGLPSEC